MKRRQFIAGLGSAATWPLAVRAQQAAMPVVAFIGPLSEGASVRYVAAFRAGLGEVGYAEGRNVVISYHCFNNGRPGSSSRGRDCFAWRGIANCAGCKSCDNEHPDYFWCWGKSRQRGLGGEHRATGQ